MTTVKWWGKEYILIYEFIEWFYEKKKKKLIMKKISILFVYNMQLSCLRYTTQNQKLKNYVQNGARPIPSAYSALL